MKKIFFAFLSYIIIFVNSNLLSEEQKKTLKIGLLAPLSGEYKVLGDSLLYSLQLALTEINDKNVFIIPRDAGFNNEKKLISAIEDIKKEGANIIIGPLSNEDFDIVKKYSELTFISPSNISPKFEDNIISVGISLESQLLALTNFLKKKKKKKTVIMFPNNSYKKLVETKLDNLNLSSFKRFNYNPNPEVLTGEIEILTNYSQRKKI